MGNGLNLLRMLEPPVRPDGVNRAPSTARQPLEQQSFESLLAAAQADNAAAPTAQGNAPAATNDTAGTTPCSGGSSPLADLASIDRIDNAHLRHLLNGTPTAADPAGAR